MSDWTILGRTDTRQGVATIAERSELAPNLFGGTTVPPYVKLHCDDKSEIFTLEPRPGAIGNDIFVAVGAFGIGQGDSKPCLVQFITKKEFLRQQLLRTKGGKVALVGAFVALFGIVLDWVMKALAAAPNPQVPFLAEYRAAFLALAALIQTIGLGIVFWKAFKKGEY